MAAFCNLPFAIRGIHQLMIDAWNAGDGATFAAPFSDEADFVVWEGTHLKGRQEIALFTQRIFETVMKGSRLEGEVKFVRFINPVLAVMHPTVRVMLPGQTKSSRGRDSMELTIVRKQNGVWRGEGLMNARRLTIEQQLFWDDFDMLSVEAQRQVTGFAASLKRRHV